MGALIVANIDNEMLGVHRTRYTLPHCDKFVSMRPQIAMSPKPMEYLSIHKCNPASGTR